MALTIPIIAEYDGKNLDKAIKQFSQLEGAGAKSAFALKKAFLPAVAALGALTAGLTLATKAAMEDEAGQVELARQLKATTQATDRQVAAAEKFISSLSKQTAMADDQLRPALANLVRATGSLELSQTAMAITADLATAKNIDMETASVAVAKALAGQTAALVKLDPSLKDLIDKSSSADDILKALNNTVGGAAEAFANTAEGGAKNFGIAMGELQESIGAVFLPIMEKMIPILNNVANYMAENTTVIIVLVSVVGGLAGAIVAANVALSAYTTVTKLTAIANTLLASSFTTVKASAAAFGVAIAIVAVTLTAFYELYKEGPEAIKQTLQPFKDFARAIAATVAVIGNGVLGAVELVSRGINSMVNDAINAINFLNPTKFGEIPNVPMPDFPKIPVPSFGGGSYFPPSSNAGIFAPPSPPKSTVTMPNMPSPVSPLPSVGGGGGGGSQGPGYASAPQLVDRVGGRLDHRFDMGDTFTINVNGGISTSAEIGKSVVDAINQYKQVYGPVNFSGI